MSNQNNKSRLTLLALREELLEESFDDARQSLKSVVDDEKKYEVVLKSLILQVRASRQVACATDGSLTVALPVLARPSGPVHADGEGRQGPLPCERRSASQPGKG